MKKNNKIQKRVLFVLFLFLFLFTLPCVSNATEIPIDVNLQINAGSVNSFSLNSIDATIYFADIATYSGMSMTFSDTVAHPFTFSGIHNGNPFSETGTYAGYTIGSGSLVLSANLLTASGVKGLSTFDFNATTALPYPVYTDGPAAGVARFQAVPIPAAAWLLGSGLIGLFGVRRKILG